MDRLDLRYGCSEKLVDAVLTDISKLKKIPDGNNIKFLRFIEVVEKSWLDLKGMGLEREMNTSIMISKIEKLIPTLQRREWALVRRKMMSIKKTCSFEYLLEFLRNERVAIEYMSEDVSVDSTKRVNLIDSNYEGLMVESNHNEEMINAWNPELTKIKEIVDGLVQVVKGISSSNNFRNDGGNNRRSINRYDKKCWFHDNDSHGIDNCFQFNALDPRTRLEEAKKHFVCFRCLKTGHIGRNCVAGTPCTVTNSNNEQCGKTHHENTSLL